MLRMTFPAKRPGVDPHRSQPLHAGKRWKLVWSHVRVERPLRTVTGFHLVNGWGKERYLYFAAQYSRPFDRFTIISDGKPVIYDSATVSAAAAEAAGTNLQFLAKYKTKPDEVILVKVAVSAVERRQRPEEPRCRNPRMGF